MDVTKKEERESKSEREKERESENIFFFLASSSSFSCFSPVCIYRPKYPDFANTAGMQPVQSVFFPIRNKGGICTSLLVSMIYTGRIGRYGTELTSLIVGPFSDDIFHLKTFGDAVFATIPISSPKITFCCSEEWACGMCEKIIPPHSLFSVNFYRSLPILFYPIPCVFF